MNIIKKIFKIWIKEKVYDFTEIYTSTLKVLTILTNTCNIDYHTKTTTTFKLKTHIFQFLNALLIVCRVQDFFLKRK